MKQHSISDQERGTPVGGLARSTDEMRPKRVSVDEDTRVKHAGELTRITDDASMMRPKRVSINEDTRVKRLSNISSPTDQLSKFTQERTERKEITPIHRKKSTTAELVSNMGIHSILLLTCLTFLDG